MISSRPLFVDGKWNPECIQFDSPDNPTFWLRMEYMGTHSDPKTFCPPKPKKTTSIFPRGGKKQKLAKKGKKGKK